MRAANYQSSQFSYMGTCSKSPFTIRLPPTTHRRLHHLHSIHLAAAAGQRQGDGACATVKVQHHIAGLELCSRGGIAYANSRPWSCLSSNQETEKLHWSCSVTLVTEQSSQPPACSHHNHPHAEYQYQFRVVRTSLHPFLLGPPAASATK